MIVLLGSIAALAMGVAGVPVSQASWAADAPAPATVDPTDELLRKYDEAQFAGRFADALAIAGKIEPDNPAGEAFVAAMKATALLGLKREAEARTYLAKAEQLAPSSADASRVVFIGALLADQPGYAADALDRMLARAPDMVRELDWDMVRYFLSHEPKDRVAQNEERRVALARIGYGGDTPIGHWRAAEAVEILARRGDFAGAAELVQYVNEPESFENMLIQKRYSALWPKLEELAGPHLDTVRAASARSSERAYLEAPDDHQKLQSYVNALRHAGRIDEAIALRSRLPATRAAMAEADEQMGWAVNNVGYALFQAGRGDEADDLLAQLNDAPMANAGWRVSMIINRLEMLATGGKFEKAAGLLDATEKSAKTDGSPYAQQLVRRLRHCILSSLGRKAEAARSLPEMLKHADDALQPTIDGLLCAGDVGKAEQLALAGLKNADAAKRSEFEEGFVRALQPVALTSDDPSVWQERWSELAKRPAVAREFHRLGREMPEQLRAPKPNPAGK